MKEKFDVDNVEELSPSCSLFPTGYKFSFSVEKLNSYFGVLPHMSVYVNSVPGEFDFNVQYKNQNVETMIRDGGQTRVSVETIDETGIFTLGGLYSVGKISHLILTTNFAP